MTYYDPSNIDPAAAIQQDVINEKKRHRLHLRSGRKRHSGQSLGSMTERKYKKTHAVAIKGSRVEYLYVPGFLLSQKKAPPIILD